MKSTVFSATEHFPLVCTHVPTVLKVITNLLLFGLLLLLILLLLLLLFLILLLQLLLLPLLLLLMPLLQLLLLLPLLLLQLLQILLALRQEDGVALGVQLYPDPGLSLSRVCAGAKGRQGFKKTVLGRRQSLDGQQAKASQGKTRQTRRFRKVLLQCKVYRRKVGATQGNAGLETTQGKIRQDNARRGHCKGVTL